MKTCASCRIHPASGELTVRRRGRVLTVPSPVCGECAALALANWARLTAGVERADRVVQQALA